MNVLELTDDSPKVEQPPRISVALKPHQLAAVHKCLEIERNPIKIDDHTTVRSRIGIIGDDVGAGKSYIVMALLTTSVERVDETITQSYSRSKFVVDMRDIATRVGTKLLIIPHTLLHQWTKYLKILIDVNYAVIGKHSTMCEVLKNGISTYQFVVVTTTFVKDFMEVANDRSIKFDRVIIDEADQIKISPTMIGIDACFFWFVSACHTNFSYPYGMRVFSEHHNSSHTSITGIRHHGFVKNVFVDLINTRLTGFIVVKNSKAFIAASFTLPEIIYTEVKCRSSHAVRVLAGIVNKNIMNCLNADDIDSALAYVSPARKGTESNIIGMLLEKYHRQINNLKTELEFKNMLTYDSDDAKVRAIEKLEKEKIKIETDVTNMTTRLAETQTCCICFENVNKKTIAPCCSNAYCFKCINTWLSKSSTCPLCKSIMTSDSFYVVHDAESAERQEVVLDKYQSLEKIIKNLDDSSRIIIFSEYDISFDKIREMLRTHKLPFARLKGHNASISSTVQAFESGSVRVILANTNDFGYGLNLQCTTDVILFHKFNEDVTRQAIGRAQRCGRKTPLHVWKLLHQNELEIRAVDE